MLTELREVVTVLGCYIILGVGSSHRLLVIGRNLITLSGPEPNNSELTGLDPVQLLGSGLAGVVRNLQGVGYVPLLHAGLYTILILVNATGSNVVLTVEIALSIVKRRDTVVGTAQQAVVIQVDSLVASVVDLDIVEVIVRAGLRGGQGVIDVVVLIHVGLGVDHNLGHDQINIVVVGDRGTVNGLYGLNRVGVSKHGQSGQYAHQHHDSQQSRKNFTHG